jgi:hypothetical protein
LSDESSNAAPATTVRLKRKKKLEDNIKKNQLKSCVRLQEFACLLIGGEKTE